MGGVLGEYIGAGVDLLGLLKDVLFGFVYRFDSFYGICETFSFFHFGAIGSKIG